MKYSSLPNIFAASWKLLKKKLFLKNKLGSWKFLNFTSDSLDDW